ncbi:MAG: hypothetical protein OXQ31_02470 [Spirochaetaceae bacterium]|nr:hypothetical protein [Spirochaetaceae bacterium]
MTATQKYLCDLQGYLLVEDVLTDEECETAKHKITERMQPLEKPPTATTRTAPGTAARGWSKRASRSSR